MRRRRATSIFSFAFLDILATTIGVLIFMLLLGVVDQGGVLEAHKLEVELAAVNEQAASLERKALNAELDCGKARSAAVAAQQELSAFARTRSSAAHEAVGENAELREHIAELEREIAEQERSRGRVSKAIALLKEEIEETRLRGERLRLPVAVRGAKTIPVHVDCREEGVVVLGTRTGDDPFQRESCPLSRLRESNSPFMRLISRINSAAERNEAQMSIVLWVRPEGLKTFRKARRNARKLGVPIGWEPADADWEL